MSGNVNEGDNNITLPLWNQRMQIIIMIWVEMHQMVISIDFARSFFSKFGADAEVVAIFGPRRKYSLVRTRISACFAPI